MIERQASQLIHSCFWKEFYMYQEAKRDYDRTKTEIVSFVAQLVVELTCGSGFLGSKVLRFTVQRFNRYPIGLLVYG